MNKLKIFEDVLKILHQKYLGLSSSALSLSHCSLIQMGEDINGERSRFKNDKDVTTPLDLLKKIIDNNLL